VTLLPKNPTKPTNTTSIINGQQLEALSSCGSCCGPGRDRQPLDSVLVSLFDVSPLGDADPEENIFETRTYYGTNFLQKVVVLYKHCKIARHCLQKMIRIQIGQN